MTPRYEARLYLPVASGLSVRAHPVGRFRTFDRAIRRCCIVLDQRSRRGESEVGVFGGVWDRRLRQACLIDGVLYRVCAWQGVD